MQIHHIAVKVFDLEAMSSFYKMILREEPKFLFDDNFEKRSTWFKLGETILMLEKLPPSREATDTIQGFDLIAFSISASQRREWKQRLSKHGITIEDESQYSIYFSDPEGNRLALSHYPEEYDA